MDISSFSISEKIMGILDANLEKSEQYFFLNHTRKTKLLTALENPSKVNECDAHITKILHAYHYLLKSQLVVSSVYDHWKDVGKKKVMVHYNLSQHKVKKSRRRFEDVSLSMMLCHELCHLSI